VREGQKDGDPIWTVGRVALWPIGFYLGEHFEFRVPVDDENTLSIAWFYMRVPKGREPYVQDRIPTWHSPIKKEDGRWISSHTINQDIIAWVGQGTIADRSKEYLGASDGGIVMMRRQYFKDLDAIANGQDPKGIIRDPAVAKRVDLPNPTGTVHRDGMTVEDMKKHRIYGRRLHGFPWHAGQPKEVWDEYAAAMGFNTPAPVG
jgi:5,5'-dehydrodivanillate O-demethylase